MLPFFWPRCLICTIFCFWMVFSWERERRKGDWGTVVVGDNRPGGRWYWPSAIWIHIVLDQDVDMTCHRNYHWFCICMSLVHCCIQELVGINSAVVGGGGSLCGQQIYSEVVPVCCGSDKKKKRVSGLVGATVQDVKGHRKPHNSKSTRFCGICPVCKPKATPQSYSWLWCSCRQYLWQA